MINPLEGRGDISVLQYKRVTVTDEPHNHSKTNDRSHQEILSDLHGSEFAFSESSELDHCRAKQAIVLIHRGHHQERFQAIEDVDVIYADVAFEPVTAVFQQQDRYVRRAVGDTWELGQSELICGAIVGIEKTKDSNEMGQKAVFHPQDADRKAGRPT